MKSKLIKWIFPVLFLLILISCTLEEPVIPTWVAQWGIPFDDSFTMIEALDDPNFITDTTSTGEVVIAISVSDTSEEKTVTSSDLAIKPDDDAAGENIDDLSLGTQGPERSSTFDLSTIMGAPVTPGTINIPAGMSVDIDLIYLLYYDIIYAHVETGTFQIELVNNTPLDIDAGTLITIYDDSTNTMIGTTQIPQVVPSNSSVFATPDMILDDKVIHTRFRLVMQVPLAEGSYDVTQTDIDNSTSWVNGTLFDLKVLEAEAKFPEQMIFIADSTSIMEEDHRIRKGIIDEGRILITLENNINATARVNVRLLNFSSMVTGETLVDSVVLQPMSETEKTILVEDYRIADYPDSTSGDWIDYIHYEVDIVTDSTETYVTIHQDDNVFVTVEPDSLFFRMIDGDIDRIEIEIDPIVKDDFEDFDRIDGQIFLDSLQMRMNLYNETNLPIDITLLISGTDGIEEITLDPITREIPRAEDGGYLPIVLDGDDAYPNIVDLMGILPTSIRMEAEAFIDGEGSVEVGQNVWADYNIYSPLFLRITDSSIITPDMHIEEIEEETQNDLRDKVIDKPTLQVELSNALPVGSVSSIYVSNDSTNLYDNTTDSLAKFIIPDIIVDAALLDSDGFVESAEKSEIIIELTDEQVAVFYSNDKLYIGTKVKLNPTDGLVKFRPEDGMDIFGFFIFQYLIDTDTEE